MGEEMANDTPVNRRNLDTKCGFCDKGVYYRGGECPYCDGKGNLSSDGWSSGAMFCA